MHFVTGNGGVKPRVNSNWDRNMIAAGNVNVGIMVIRRISSLYPLSSCLQLMLMFPCFVLLAVAKEEIHRIVVWVAELGTMSTSRGSALEFMLDCISRKMGKDLESVLNLGAVTYMS